MNKDVKFIPSTGAALTFDALTGFAINPEGESAIAFSANFRDVVLTLVGTGTIIVYGSSQQSPPDFTTSSSITNSYTPIRLNDYSVLPPNDYLAGVTGITLSNETKIIELDTNLLTWIGIHRSANTVDVLLTLTNAQ